MSQQQDATSHNLSHAMKPGYRREIIRFDSIGQPSDLIGPATSLHTDFSPGIHEYTGNNLDVAINGPGFFSVDGPDGPLYTRSGVFSLNERGQIVTPEGHRVQGQNGPITIPLDSLQSRIEILNDGSIVVNGAAFDHLKVTAFQNPAELQRAGSSLFTAPTGIVTSPAASEVRQGYRELGNSSVVNEMVQMLGGSRQFEAIQRALRQIGDTIAFNTRPR